MTPLLGITGDVLFSLNVRDPHLYLPCRPTRWLMIKKEHATKLVDEKSGLMECLV